MCVYVFFFPGHNFLASPGVARCLSLRFLSASVGRTVCFNFIASGRLSCLLEPSPWNPGPLLLLLPFLASLCVVLLFLLPWLHSSKLTVSVACQLLVPFPLNSYVLVRTSFTSVSLSVTLCFRFVESCWLAQNQNLVPGVLCGFWDHVLLTDRAVPRTTSFFSPGPANAWHVVKIQSLGERVYIAHSVFAFTKSRTVFAFRFSLASYVVRALGLAWYIPFWRSAFEWMTSHKTSGLWCSNL